MNRESKTHGLLWDSSLWLVNLLLVAWKSWLSCCLWLTLVRLDGVEASWPYMVIDPSLRAQFTCFLGLEIVVSCVACVGLAESDSLESRLNAEYG